MRADDWSFHDRCPAECLLPPLTGIELRRTRIVGSVLVAEVALSINLHSLPIEKVVAKMQSSQLQLLDLLSSDLRQAGCPARSLLTLDGLAVETMQREPTWFNAADQYRRATNDALDAQRETMAALSVAAAWEHEEGGDASIATRMRSCALVCARAQETATAALLLRMAQAREATFDADRVQLAMESTGVATEEERRILQTAEPLLSAGALAPWPAVLVDLARREGSTDACKRALVMLAKPWVDASRFAVGASVLVRHGIYWQRAVIQRVYSTDVAEAEAQARAATAPPSHPDHPHPLVFKALPENRCDICAAVGTRLRCGSGCDWDLCQSCFDSKPAAVAAAQVSNPVAGDGIAAPVTLYDVLLVDGWNALSALRPNLVLAVSEGGPGALLRAAAAAADETLLDALLSAGVSPFESDASARTALHVAAAGTEAHAGCVRRLVAARADAHTMDTQQNFAWRIAMRGGGVRALALARAMTPYASDKDWTKEACTGTALLRVRFEQKRPPDTPHRPYRISSTLYRIADLTGRLKWRRRGGRAAAPARRGGRCHRRQRRHCADGGEPARPAGCCRGAVGRGCRRWGYEQGKLHGRHGRG